MTEVLVGDTVSTDRHTPALRRVVFGPHVSSPGTSANYCRLDRQVRIRALALRGLPDVPPVM